MLRKQRTLKQPISCYGMGLHTGMIVNVTMRPQPSSSGVVFQRLDLAGKPTIRASYKKIFDTNLATSLANGKANVRTVEHLLAAFAGMGLDNVLVQIDAPEIPIMDGSAAPFIHLIKQAGVVEQRVVQPCLRVKRFIDISEGEKRACIFPADWTQITCAIEFDHPLIREQKNSYIHSERNFTKEIGPARTFGFKNDVEILLENGLARGGSLDNAVVVDNYRVLNEGGLRFKDEFVRHKILDSLGDLFLTGFPVLGHLVGVKSGHKLNSRLIVKLMSDPDAWELVSAKVGVASEGIPRAPEKITTPLSEPATA